MAAGELAGEWARMSVAMNASTNRLLQLLYDHGERFVAADELARAAGLDRTGLARALRELRNGGQHIEVSPAYGMRLVRPIKLCASLIERDLQVRRVGRNVICFDSVVSTNDVAMASARQGGADGLVVLAETQRHGRGRQGRRWIGEPGGSILMSVLLLGGGAAARHEAVTIAAGLAVAQGIEDACGLRAGLKWPNDVLIDGEKVAGVLIESRPQGGQVAVVIGVGINVNASPAADLVDRPATDLARHVGQAVERTEVVRAVLRRLDGWVGPLDEVKLDELHAAWISRCAMINERVRVRCEDTTYAGRVVDVSPMDGLTLFCDDGCRVQLPADRSTIVP